MPACALEVLMDGGSAGWVHWQARSSRLQPACCSTLSLWHQGRTVDSMHHATMQGRASTAGWTLFTRTERAHRGKCDALMCHNLQVCQ